MLSEKYNLTTDQAKVLVAIADGAVMEQSRFGFWVLDGERFEYRSTVDRFTSKSKPRLTHMSYDDWEFEEPEDADDTGRRHLPRMTPKVVLTDLGREAAAVLAAAEESEK